MADDPFARFFAALKLAKGLMPGQSKKAEHIFRYEPRDFPVCHTRVVREGRGFPWQRQVALHTLANGHIEMRAVEAPRGKLPKKL